MINNPTLAGIYFDLVRFMRRGDIMMNNIFSLRLDDKTYRQLRVLARLLSRNRSKVVRYLINLAIQNPQLILNEINGDSGTLTLQTIERVLEGVRK
jgi:hypothetical protein